MQVIILAGGAGSRLWPASTDDVPKQFLKVRGESLLVRSVSRIRPLNPAGVWISTSSRYVLTTREQIPDLSIRILAEPARRNTAAAVGYSVMGLVRGGVGPGEIVAILPADQEVADGEAFRAALRSAAEAASASGLIVTLGIRPTSPETGYGYIELGEGALCGGAARGSEFVEKPSREVAQEYVAGGRHLWNAGIFVGTLSAFLAAFEARAPEILPAAKRSWDCIDAGDPDGSRREFEALPDVPFDIAIMERIGNFGVVPLECGWSDIGSWESLAEILGGEGENRIEGEARIRDGAGNVVYGGSRPIVLIGVSDLVIVDGPGGVLVARKGRSSEIKALRN